MKKGSLKSACWMAVAAALVLTDWLTKRWAEQALAPVGRMALWDGVVGFCYAENTGAAFSSFSGATMLLGIVSLVICIGVAVYKLRHPEADWLTQSALSMVLAGGIGNLIDRIVRGYVVDFIEVLFIEFAIFNVADICVTVGAALLFIALLRGGEKNDGMAR